MNGVPWFPDASRCTVVSVDSLTDEVKNKTRMERNYRLSNLLNKFVAIFS